MTYMKILLLLMFCTVLPMQAQQMKKLTDLKDFEARLLQEAKNIESIESNFTQIKYLDVFDEKITSKGTFYYKKSNKICMDYAQPMNYRGSYGTASHPAGRSTVAKVQLATGFHETSFQRNAHCPPNA